MPDARDGVIRTAKTRAQRFELQIPLRYRTNGDGGWHMGRTRNISRSGMLFHGEDWAPPSARVEMTLVLPRPIGLVRAAEVICQGMITRSERRGIEEGGPLMAIRISHYRLVRPKGDRQLEVSSHH